MNISDQPLTVVVRRRVKEGKQNAFEAAMSDFIAFALSFPGNQGIHVVRPGAKSAREYIVVDRFADLASRQAFKASPPYQDWMRRLGELTEGEPYMEEVGGVGGWFTLPAIAGARPPSKVKMALVTFLGVYPLTAIIPRLMATLLAGWHPLIVNAFTTAIIVGALTWIVMPLLTRLFRPWLFKAERAST